MLRRRPASRSCGNRVGAVVVGAVVLPAADGLGAVKGVLLPVLDAGLLVEERWGGAVAVFGGGAVCDLGGYAGELVGGDEGEDLEEELLGVVETVLQAFYVAFCGTGMRFSDGLDENENEY
jgi:hypothetical protein